MRLRLPPAAKSLLLTCGIALTLHAQAVPLTYVEATDGDLPRLSPWVSLLLGEGTNTISGSSFMTTSPLTADFDNFRFVVPQGHQLTGIRYQSAVTSSTGSPAFLRIDTYLDTFNPTTLLANELIDVIQSSDAGESLSTHLPLLAGEYLIFQGQYQISPGASASFDYVWTLDVAAVPEPGSLVLAGVGLFAAWGLRRRGKLLGALSLAEA